MIGVTRVLRATLRPAADLLDVTGEAAAALGLLTTGLLFRTLTSLEAPHGPGSDAPAATDPTVPPPRRAPSKPPSRGSGP